MSKKNLAVLLCCLAFIILAFGDINAFVANARSGLLLFGNNVLPILFPFFFISSLLIEIGMLKKCGARTGVVLLSILSGYPTSAKMLTQLYERGDITRKQAIHTLTYTSTTSPIFIIATMGAALFCNIKLGVIIFISHILGAFINGLVFAKTRFNEIPHKTLDHIIRPHLNTGKQSAPQHLNNSHLDLSESISRALYSSVQSILAVGGLIVIFFITAAPFGIAISSILEMTNGVFQASELNISETARSIISCAIVSFGGFCVALQGFVFLKSLKLPVWFYFSYKITHTLFAVIICTILTLVFL